MRQTLSRGVFAAAAATSILSLYGSPAFADSDATGAAGGSPGVLSGNNVQAPVNVPINICGNSVDAASALNPAFGNSCVNTSDSHRHSDSRFHGMPYGHHRDSGYGDSGYGDAPPAYGDSAPPSHGGQTPPSYGQDTPPPHGGHNSPPCTDTPPGHSTPPSPPGHSTPPAPPRHSTPPSPPAHSTPPSPPAHSTPPRHSTPPSLTTPPGGGQQHGAPPTLAHTGSEGMLAASAASAVLIAGGTILYRRGRATSRRS
ncbi:chaplin family protein [Streptomyces sp. NPDC048277]|uniref:chaplin n=1 Tax=Streptomyces sp. NPDC048277 TaxID=3155027 RepID=UPI003400D9C1